MESQVHRKNDQKGDCKAQSGKKAEKGEQLYLEPSAIRGREKKRKKRKTCVRRGKVNSCS